MEIAKEIRKLAARRRAIILAHHYQVEEVQSVADYTGDSYGLAVTASRSDAEVIVMCGVRFMAESVALLSPGRRVLLPRPDAGCPLADTITAEDVKSLRKEYPGAPVVSYVNTTAAVKALSDYCCTSANALAVVNGIEARRVIFVPDQNLADYVAGLTDKEIIPWQGFCHVHHEVRAQDILDLRGAHPGAVLLAHPECRREVLALADAVASTTGIFAHAASSEAETFIIGTEEGVLPRLRRENPGKKFYPARPGMVCPNMKLTTPEDVLAALENLEPAVALEAEVAEPARKALARMVAITD